MINEYQDNPTFIAALGALDYIEKRAPNYEGQTSLIRSYLMLSLAFSQPASRSAPSVAEADLILAREQAANANANTQTEAQAKTQAEVRAKIAADAATTKQSEVAHG